MKTRGYWWSALLMGWASQGGAQVLLEPPTALRADRPGYQSVQALTDELNWESSMVRAETMEVIQEIDWQIDRWRGQEKLSQPLAIQKIYQLNDQGADISALHGALMQKGFLGSFVPHPEEQAGGISAPLVFDASLQESVKIAQEFYGLKADGIAGPLLYQNLNADPAKMIKDLQALREDWIKKIEEAQRLGHEKIVLVNIPSFYLRGIDLTTGKTVVESRVIVGMASRKTPRYLTHVVNLKFNPEWTPPPSLKARGKSFAPPGPNNPMGRVRFSTNRFDNIYLHHTNDTHLFEQNSRALSSGCVRVEKWDALAKFIADKTDESLQPFIADWRTRIHAVEPTPVWIDYHLVDVVNDGAGRYPDVYGIARAP